MIAFLLAGSGSAAEDWSPAKTVEGILIESRPTESGFDVHRGTTTVCTDIESLERFVADTSRFQEWIPYTRSAKLLDRTAVDFVYYVRTTTPWPFKDRDMIYRISRQEADDESLRLIVTGQPDYQPLADNAERIQAATGEWYLIPAAGGITVSYELYVHPGAVPRSLANRRLATAVGLTLANLAAAFPCKPA